MTTGDLYGGSNGLFSLTGKGKGVRFLEENVWIIKVCEESVSMKTHDYDIIQQDNTTPVPRWSLGCYTIHNVLQSHLQREQRFITYQERGLFGVSGTCSPH